MTQSSDDLERYSRQTRFRGLGEEGQRRLLAGRACVCGAGALGSVIANGLVRAGVGFVRIVDRDFIELNNLQRQLLYDEADVGANLPKAAAAATKLKSINSSVTIEAEVVDLDAGNIGKLCGDVDVVLDGTDNFETRFLINDFCLEKSIPWVYGGCIGSEGHTMTIVPGKTPCIQCLVESVPPPGTTPTCESAGILSPASMIVASIEIAEAIKILSGNIDKIQRELIVFDIWENTVRKLNLASLLEKGNCPACKQGKRDWLEGKGGTHTTTLCGRNAVQVAPPAGSSVDWKALHERFEAVGAVTENRFLMRLAVDAYEITVFPDGRAIIKGTNDPAVARSLYSRYVGA